MTQNKRSSARKSRVRPGATTTATARDVNAEQAVQRALRESEERYRTLFDSIDEGFCIIEMIFDAQGKAVDYRFLEINPSFEKQTGLQNAVGKRMRELAPEHEAHWFEIYGRIASTGEPARFQNRAEQLHRTYDVFAFRFGEPEKRQVAILFNDITESRRMEEALRESEARYRKLFNSIDEGFCIIEVIFDAQERPVDYRLLEINPSFEKQTGLRNALGRRMRELAPEHEAHWYETYGRVAMTGEAVRFQSRAENLNRWYDLYAFRFGEPKNRQVAVLFNDITERKTDAEKIARLNAELLGRARELEAANKELESFSYSVSHDLRAPLRHVQGYVDMLARATEGQLSEKALRYLKTIADAGAEMGQLIDDLLGFSRMSRKEVEEANVSLDLLVQDAVRSLDIAAQGRTTAWKIAPLPQVLGDPALLKQVLANLLGNAVKYTRQRDPAEIEIGCAGKEDGRVILFVRDNGAGFDMQYAHKLFGVFQRLHRSDEFEGTGIGLATVRRIISRHGGRTWGEGKVGEGATFYFTLKPATTA